MSRLLATVVSLRALPISWRDPCNNRTMSQDQDLVMRTGSQTPGPATLILNFRENKGGKEGEINEASSNEQNKKHERRKEERTTAEMFISVMQIRGD